MTQPPSKHKASTIVKSLLIGIILAGTLQSCYSVRIVSRNGEPEKKAASSEAGYYRDKVSHTMDTTITLNVIQDDFSLIEAECPYGFYSVEYKVGLGNALLNMVTFGKVKRVKIKYVCSKEEN